MRFTGKWPSKGQTALDRNKERQVALDFLRNRGTAKLPQAPRDIIVQSGSRGVLLTWNLPQVFFDIIGWRVYKNDENTLFHELRDRGNRQLFVECTSGTTPPTTNFFVSSINALGRESRKVQAQGKATAETGAPSIPSTPPEYTKTASGGSDRSNYYGRINNSKLTF